MENFDGTIGKITVAVLKAGLHSRTEVPLVVGHVYPCSLRRILSMSPCTRRSMISDASRVLSLRYVHVAHFGFPFEQT